MNICLISYLLTVLVALFIGRAVLCLIMGNILSIVRPVYRCNICNVACLNCFMYGMPCLNCEYDVGCCSEGFDMRVSYCTVDEYVAEKGEYPRSYTQGFLSTRLIW